MLRFEIPDEIYFAKKDPIDALKKSTNFLEHLVGEFERKFNRELSILNDASDEFVEIITKLIAENDQLREAANGYKQAYEDLIKAHE